MKNQLMMNKITFLSFLLIVTQVFSQKNYWSKKNTYEINKEEVKPRLVNPKLFSLYKLDLDNIISELKKAPDRSSKKENTVLKFPDSNGTITDYIVQEASVMAPELQAKFPEIRSYLGWQKNKPENSIRFSITPETGINIMYFDQWDISYLDPYTKDNSTYILYKRKELPKNDRLFECHVENTIDETITENNNLLKTTPLVSDGQFRTYRLALSATGEYTSFQGGTKALALAAMVTTMTRVNGIYEKTISTTMQLVANNDLIIYTNSATDPFTNGNPNTMITQNQNNTTSVIGSANYDIGHVFGTNSGGLAGLGVVCQNSSKARGVTGSSAPVGDPFDIDYVAHEIGHQFGANHTFRGNAGACNGNGNNDTAYEPGSGSTIMAYAGICSPMDIQNNSDPYFHAASILEMYAVLQRVNDCAVKTPNNNSTPTADAGLDYTIPKGTAFVLTGIGTDPDNDSLTYLWEQYDNSSNTQPPVNTATVGPVYRSVTPRSSPSRYFPALSEVIANNLSPKWEVTPNVARTLNFSLVVNDNKATGNQASRDTMVLTVTNDGPFTVTSQSVANASLEGGSTTSVDWNVAGTNTGTINTQNVTILLSKNNGLTFDTVLIESTPNTGTATITLPNEDIASARIMVKALNNVYYALNTKAFKIVKNNTLSINDINKQSISIYPNPSKDFVTININNNLKNKYSIYTTSGQLVKTGTIENNQKLNISHLVNGNYIISINTEDGKSFSEKLIIKK